jgi:hypothetical protein
MTNVAEFIETRQRIETLISQITVLAERKPLSESTQRLDEATQFLGTLKTMVDSDNDVQVRVIDRLTSELNALGKKVAKGKVTKKVAAKKRPTL